MYIYELNYYSLTSIDNAFEMYVACAGYIRT